jgi:hypothetical protein
MCCYTVAFIIPFLNFAISTGQGCQQTSEDNPTEWGKQKG